MQSLRSYWHDLKAKMVRDPLPPEDVAAGWALGMFIGCSIPFGFQLIVSIPLAIMMRVSKVGATLGTLITNPVTIFIIYPVQTWAVNKFVFSGSLSFQRLMDMEWTWEAVRRLGVDAMMSFFIGGIVLALVLSPITYFTVKRIVVRYRRRGGFLRSKQQ